MTLDKLKLNECGYIKKTPTMQRLQDLGFTKDARITYITSSPFNDPKAYRIRGSTIALRKKEQEKIEIEEEKL